MVPRHKVILLDEPTSGLDPKHARLLGGVLLRLAACGHAVVVNTHDMKFATTFGDRLAVVQDGRVIKDGSVDMVVKDGSVEKLVAAERAISTARKGGRREEEEEEEAGFEASAELRGPAASIEASQSPAEGAIEAMAEQIVVRRMSMLPGRRQSRTRAKDMGDCQERRQSVVRDCVLKMSAEKRRESTILGSLGSSRSLNPNVVAPCPPGPRDGLADLDLDLHICNGGDGEVSIDATRGSSNMLEEVQKDEITELKEVDEAELKTEAETGGLCTAFPQSGSAGTSANLLAPQLALELRRLAVVTYGDTNPGLEVELRDKSPEDLLRWLKIRNTVKQVTEEKDEEEEDESESGMYV